MRITILPRPLQVRIRAPRLSGCWRWAGSVTPAGYARFNGRYAHRVAWVHVNGQIPERMVLHHACGTRECVRPDHLRLVERGPHIAEHAASRPRLSPEERRERTRQPPRGGGRGGRGGAGPAGGPTSRRPAATRARPACSAGRAGRATRARPRRRTGAPWAWGGGTRAAAPPPPHVQETPPPPRSPRPQSPPCGPWRLRVPRSPPRSGPDGPPGGARRAQSLSGGAPPHQDRARGSGAAPLGRDLRLALRVPRAPEDPGAPRAGGGGG